MPEDPNRMNPSGPLCAHPAADRSREFSARDYITGDAFEIAHCSACGATFTDPRPAAEAMGRYYPAAYYRKSGKRRFPAIVEFVQQRLYAARARKIEKLREGERGEVIDIGCGPGWLLNAMRERGWAVCGTEMSESAAAFARETMNLPVESKELRDLGFADGRFDAVLLWHVLEHDPEPEILVAEIARILKPGGVFFVGIPNYGCPGSRWSRDKWFALDVPRHLSHLSADRLRRLLEGAGFQVRAERYLAPEYDFFGFVQTVLNRIGLRHNLLYLALKGQLGGALKGARWGWAQVALTLVLTPILSVLAAPVCVTAAVFRQGASVSMYAVRKAD